MGEILTPSGYESIRSQERSSDEWVEIIRSTGKCFVGGMLPPGGVAAAARLIEQTSEGGAYCPPETPAPLFPEDLTTRETTKISMGVRSASEGQVYDQFVNLAPEDRDYLLVSRWMYDPITERWDRVDGIAFIYDRFLKREAYPPGESRPVVPQVLGIVLGEKEGCDLVDQILKRPRLISEIFERICEGLEDKVEKQEQLEVIEGGETGWKGKLRGREPKLFGGKRSALLTY